MTDPWCPRCGEYQIDVRYGPVCPVCLDQQGKEHDEQRKAAGWV